MKGLSELPYGQYLSQLLAMNEYIFQSLDASTRRTGRLVKYSRIFDASGMSPARVHLGFLRSDAKAQATLQDLYPQQLGTVYVCAMPTFLRVLYENVIKPLMPQRLQEKVCIR
ncbi:hypothetical protein OAO87_04245 [bacterium]|nr:hypothetical protein [bacterium]